MSEEMKETFPRPGLYLVTRTSERGDAAPCPEAFKVYVKIYGNLTPRWAIETDDIFGFVKRYGDCILSESWGDWFNVEIYDDYIE